MFACIHLFLKIEPSFRRLWCLLDDFVSNVEEEEDPLPVDFMDPNFDKWDIRTVWVSSSSILSPRLSVTLLSSRTAPIFSENF